MIKETFDILIERRDFFIPLIIEHLRISGSAIAAGTVIGLILGIIVSKYRSFAPPVIGVTNIIYTIPSIALFGFLIPVTGIGDRTAVAALTLYALLPMVRSAYTGLTNISPDITESAEGMGTDKWQMLYKIEIPLAMPVIISGFRNMTVMTVALAGIASFIGAGGLGVAIYRGITTNNTAMTLAGSVLIAALAFGADIYLGFVEKYAAARRYGRLKAVLAIGAIIAAVTIFYGAAKEKESIKIATKPMTEQFIIGEMLKILIETDTGLKTEVYKGIGGGTSNIHPAILKGDFDMYPEYTGTAWKFVLKKTDELSDAALTEELKKEYENRFGLAWAAFYGFNNRFGLGMAKDKAESYGINTYSQLAPYSKDLTFGAEYDFFERDDGYSALVRAYGYEFKKTSDMDIGLKYAGVSSGKVDVINLFTTDALISASDIRILKDDKKFFENYYIGTVVRLETLRKHPKLLKTLMKMENLISDEEMAEMNYMVEVKKERDADVARRFLIDKGLLERPE